MTEQEKEPTECEFCGAESTVAETIMAYRAPPVDADPDWISWDGEIQWYRSLEKVAVEVLSCGCIREL